MEIGNLASQTGQARISCRNVVILTSGSSGEQPEPLLRIGPGLRELEAVLLVTNCHKES